MNLEIYNWNELSTDNQNHIAHLVASYTQGDLGETPQMLAVTELEVLAKFASAAAFLNDAFSGYVAAAQPLLHAGVEMAEVGSLWVPSPQRGRGIAHSLVMHLSQYLVQTGKAPYAFCNPLSLGVFLDSGYAGAEAADIPKAAFEFCADCPMKPAAGCCDTVVVYKGDSDG